MVQLNAIRMPIFSLYQSPAAAKKGVAATSTDQSLTARHVYAAPKTQTSSPAPAIDTKEGRVEMGKNYDKILSNLRSQYDEKEAMRRFDAIMRADGFELVENFGHNPLAPDFGRSVNGVFNTLQGTSANDGALGELFGELGIGLNYDPFGHLQTQSSIHGEMIDGEVRWRGETWATYTATVDRQRILSDWKNAGLDELRGTTGVDVDRIVGTMGAFRAEAVDSGLGGIVADWLAKAGIVLDAEKDQRVEFLYSRDENGKPSLTASLSNMNAEAEERLNGVIAKNMQKPEIAAIFESVDAGIAKKDLNEFVDQYDDGTRSLKAQSYRAFVYSAHDPDAVVAGSYLGVWNEGYAYQKKLSDEFDPQADILNSRAYIDENYDTVVNEIGRKVREAVENGATVKSTISEEEYMSRFGAAFLESGSGSMPSITVVDDSAAIREEQEAYAAALARYDTATARLQEDADNAPDKYDSRAEMQKQWSQLYALRKNIYGMGARLFS